jgi:pimeloyl-ACP methyl ester carboxylesterase
LIIQGKEDQYGSEAQVSKIYQACIVSEGCIIPACKHHPHLERSEFVLEKISTWVTTRHLIS